MVVATTVRVVDDDGTGAELLRLDSSLGVILNSLDLGFPDVRTSTVSRAAQHGTLDTTRFYGARAVTAQITLPAANWYVVEDQIRGILDPAQRFYLYVLRDGWPNERRIQVRGATYTSSTNWPKVAQLGWVAPDSALEDPKQTVTLTPTVTGAEGGISSPISSPFSFAPGYNPGTTAVAAGGNTATSLVTADIYGPCQNPALFLASTQQTLAFNVQLNSGDFLHVDFAARTVNLNGLPAQSQYGKLDFTRSQWWALPPGTQAVSFNPVLPGAGCHAVLTWRPRYL